MKATIVVFVGAVCASSVAAAQERYPTSGLVYSTSENSSLSFECKRHPNNPNAIDCDFNQTAVRPANTPERVKNEIAEAIKEFRTGKGDMIVKECDEYKRLKEVLVSNRNPGAANPALNEHERATSIRIIDGFIRHCEAKSEATLTALLNDIKSRELRTCNVSSNAFKQTLIRQDNGVWVADSKPYGDCRVVRLDRLEPVESSTPGIQFWNYVSRKAVTNPSATFGAMKCSELDEAEYQWKWNARNDRGLNCEFIKFTYF